jgi:hypothetical protein
MMAVLENGLMAAGILSGNELPERWQRRRSTTAYRRKHDRVAARERAEALEWILDTRADGPFAFGSVCGALGIDAVRIRKQVNQNGK